LGLEGLETETEEIPYLETSPLSGAVRAMQQPVDLAVAAGTTIRHL